MRRSKLEIIAEILNYCFSSPKSITEIAKACNLNHDRAMNLIYFLYERDFLELNGTKSITTEKGKDILSKIIYIYEKVFS